MKAADEGCGCGTRVTRGVCFVRAVEVASGRSHNVELFDVLLTGFIAAVARRAGWVRAKSWPALFGAWLLAAVLHSGYDVIDGLSRRCRSSR